MTWEQMSDNQRSETLRCMRNYGGGFASRLAEAWQFADRTNSMRLGEAFVDLVERYGPGSDFYARRGL